MIDKSDLNVAYQGASSGGSAKARASRRSAVTSKRITITHRPTGATVSGEIESGHYTRKQMQASAAKLEEELLEKLERLVAKRMSKPATAQKN